MLAKVTDPTKIVTDPVLLNTLAKQGIDKDYVEFYQDYAPAFVNGVKVKGQSPYAKFYRDLKSNKRFMVVSALPMVDADGVKIEVGWRIAGINYFESTNLFNAKVHNTQIDVTVRNDQPDGRKAGDKLSFQPQLFLDDVEVACGNPVLLPIDPINPNYVNNVIEWDYSICRRRLRIIEGRLLGSWIFASKPAGEVHIKYNQVGDYRLRLGQFQINDDEEVIKPEDFDQLALLPGGYPVIISDSATFYPDADVETSSVDGRALRNSGSSETWATVHDSGGTAASDSGVQDIYDVLQSSTTTNTWIRIDGRNPILFNTASLDDAAVISAAVLSIFGANKVNTATWTHTSNIYTCNTASNTAVAAGDYNVANWGSVALCATAIAVGSWSIVGYNDFAFNAAGIAAISKTGVTKVGLRNADHDAANSAPTWENNKYSYVNGWTAEKGEGYKPKLVVTYTIPGGQPTIKRFGGVPYMAINKGVW